MRPWMGARAAAKFRGRTRVIEVLGRRTVEGNNRQLPFQRYTGACHSPCKTQPGLPRLFAGPA